VRIADDLDRFKAAQEDPRHGFATALSELQTGGKRSHWIWYIFPQLAGLGTSSMAAKYGLRDVDEAIQYLRDPVLRDRLAAVTHAVAVHLSAAPASDARRPAEPPSLAALMGSEIDARKLVSSMTLFGALSRRMHANETHAGDAALARDADTILRAAEEQGLPPCAFTSARLAVAFSGMSSSDDPRRRP